MGARVVSGVAVDDALSTSGEVLNDSDAAALRSADDDAPSKQ